MGDPMHKECDSERLGDDMHYDRGPVGGVGEARRSLRRGRGGASRVPA